MKKRSRLASLWPAALGLLFGPGAAAENTLQIGDAAPLVEAPDQDGAVWKLSDEIGRKVVLLYFYPRDNTPGCTKEACGLRDERSHWQNGKVAVIGVSFDSPAAHRRFIVKHHLNFRLVSDADGRMTDAYGARFRPRCAMNRRVSFLIGLDGKIIHVTDSPDPAAHLSEMREKMAPWTRLTPGRP